ncbi:hypothetical protein [Bergeyella zoohelcum]|uniref:Uncharacterized protein n=1 Tax=Bergeyella zoohelcum TaxID=1015 RepID=A0A380ZWW3_9FLAO|nr:hypothetical protein [Bergeyella zoohelcum]EKB58826.1 hypothetical protein HMPREF9700_01776 [Bergeyella zoohelcum CCUG 30536]SUV53219.1 Uncharacterised protein [Bergeyella zoohelcum]
MEKEKKSKYFFTIIFIALISLLIYNIVFIQPDFSKNKIWVIAEPYGIEGGGKGGSPYIKFKYRFRNKVYKKRKMELKVISIHF